MSGYRALKTKSGMTRRILAVFCVVCMAALQCMVVLPAVTEEVHAATAVDFIAEYDHGVRCTQSNSSWITGAPQETIEVGTGQYEYDEQSGEDIEIMKTITNARKLSSILGNSTLGKYASANIDGSEVNPKETYLYDEGGVWVYCEGTKEYATEIGALSCIGARLKRDAIKIDSASASKKKPVKGETVTISYSMTVDGFYKKSIEYDDSNLYLDWVASNDKVSPQTTSTDAKSGSFKVTVKKSGEVTISPNSAQFDYLSGSKKVTLSGKEPKLTATPSKVKLKVNEIKTITVKDDSGTVSYSYLTWSSSNSKVASVTSSGVIRGLSKGTATIKVKSSAPSSKGKTAKVSVTVSSSSSGGSGGYTSYRPTNRTGGTITRATVKRPSTTATRPTTSGQTLTPSFQTMTVKEVYLTSTNPYEGAEYYDEYGNPVDEYGDPIDEDEWDEEDEAWDEDGVSVPQAAGSAAVAAAACGAGVVGRIRRFKFDMSSAAIAAVVGKTTAAGGKGKNNSGRNSKADEAKDEVGKKAGKKESRNPLNKIRRK